MRLIFRLLPGLALIVCAGQSYAGAWVQDKGKALAILTTSYYSADKLWNNQGNNQAQAPYTKYDLNPYFEYGLTNRVTLGANLSLPRVHQSGYAFKTNVGLGDSELFARALLWKQDGFVLSVEPMVKLSGKGYYRDAPKVSSSHPDAGLGVSAGYGFSLAGQNHFINLDSGYRYRFGMPKNQMKFAATLGIGITKRLTIMPQVFATYRTQKPTIVTFTQSAGDDYNLVRAQLSAVYTLAPRYSLQLGAFEDVQGRNAGKGRGMLFSIWRTF